MVSFVLCSFLKHECYGRLGNCPVECMGGLPLQQPIFSAKFRTPSCSRSFISLHGTFQSDSLQRRALPDTSFLLSWSISYDRSPSTQLIIVVYTKLGTMDCGIRFKLYNCRKHSPVLLDHGSFDYRCIDSLWYATF